MQILVRVNVFNTSQDLLKKNSKRKGNDFSNQNSNSASDHEDTNRLLLSSIKGENGLLEKENCFSFLVVDIEKLIMTSDLLTIFFILYTFAPQ